MASIIADKILKLVHRFFWNYHADGRATKQNINVASKHIQINKNIINMHDKYSRVTIPTNACDTKQQK